MARLSKNLYVAYGGKTYTIPLYDTHDGMTAYSYMIVDGKQAYINLVAENSGLATTPLHIKEHTGSQFRVTDRKICKVTVKQKDHVRYQTLKAVHRGTTYKNSATFYAIAGESINVKTSSDYFANPGDIIVNGTDTNTSNYTFTVWGDTTITAEYPSGNSCSTDSSGCGGEGG